MFPGGFFSGVELLLLVDSVGGEGMPSLVFLLAFTLILPLSGGRGLDGHGRIQLGADQTSITAMDVA